MPRGISIVAATTPSPTRRGGLPPSPRAPRGRGLVFLMIAALSKGLELTCPLTAPRLHPKFRRTFCRRLRAAIAEENLRRLKERRVQSLDPNDKVGSSGVLAQQYMSGATPFRYSVFFATPGSCNRASPESGHNRTNQGLRYQPTTCPTPATTHRASADRTPDAVDRQIFLVADSTESLAA